MINVVILITTDLQHVHTVKVWVSASAREQSRTRTRAFLGVRMMFCYVWSRVCFQMSPQRGCVVNLVAFVSLLCAVCFQVCPQLACPIGCIATLVTFVWLFSIVCFKYDLKAIT